MSYENERAAQEAAAAADSAAPVQVGDDPDAYQREALRFAFYPRITMQCSTIEIPVYPALALMGEIGELAAKCMAGERDAQILAECGDVLWYVAALARSFGLAMSEIRVGWPRCNDSDYGAGEIHRVIVGLVAQAGQFTEVFVKKPWRDGVIIQNDMAASHLVGILVRLSMIAKAHGATLSQVAQLNIDKLTSRRARGKLTGSGDDR